MANAREGDARLAGRFELESKMGRREACRHPFARAMSSSTALGRPLVAWCWPLCTMQVQSHWAFGYTLATTSVERPTVKISVEAINDSLPVEGLLVSTDSRRRSRNPLLQATNCPAALCSAFPEPNRSLNRAADEPVNHDARGAKSVTGTASFCYGQEVESARWGRVSPNPHPASVWLSC